MHPELFTIPMPFTESGISIKTYGFCLMVGFLSAVWFAMRRAERVKASSDRVLDISFLALFFGVGGARLFYVLHYWKTDFAPAPNKFMAVIDIRQGGLEFLGGFLAAALAIFIYLTIKRESARLYLDIMAPSVMWGLAFGRIGCFFNGCCFGGLCVAPGTDRAAYSWAVQFPFGSPAHVREWEERRVTVPAELVSTRGLQSALVSPRALSLSVEKREGPKRLLQQLEEALAEAKTGGGNGATVQPLEAEILKVRKSLKKLYQEYGLADLDMAQQFPSRRNAQRKTSVSELQELAAMARSMPAHPTQLYSSVNAILLSGLLSAVFYHRKRHGVVIGLLFLLYPISRIIIEMIRTDNPHDTSGLTISQFVGLAMVTASIVYLFVLYRSLPERSPILTTASNQSAAPTNSP